MLSQVIESEHPDRLAVAFDVKGGTFRNDLLPQYKGTREAAPEELLSQLPLIQQMLKALGVTYIEKPGFEGDDVIGTLATMGNAPDTARWCCPATATPSSWSTSTSPCCIRVIISRISNT